MSNSAEEAESFDYEDNSQPPTDDELKSVADLALDQVAVEGQIARLESELHECHDRLRAISEVALPNALCNLGLMDFRLSDGTKVEISEKIVASITKEHQKQAFAWLRGNNHGDLIKTNVDVKFGRGQEEQLRKLTRFLSADLPSITAVAKEAVHPQTLGAFVREQLAANVEIPEDIFGIARLRKSVVTLASGKAGTTKTEKDDVL